MSKMVNIIDDSEDSIDLHVKILKKLNNLVKEYSYHEKFKDVVNILDFLTFNMYQHNFKIIENASNLIENLEADEEEKARED